MIRVKDIMTEYPVCCTPESNLADVARMMKENDCGEIPVVDIAWQASEEDALRLVREISRPSLSAVKSSPRRH